jgi:restriction system protein
MPIPDYQAIMLPLLKYLSDRQEHNIRDVINHISNEFDLSAEERKEPLPSGKQPVISNRVGWASTYMKKAGLINSPSRGQVIITERGLDVLRKNPPKINVKFLEKFPEFIEFRVLKKDDSGKAKPEIDADEQTPDELMEKGSKLINASLVQELLSKLRECDPYFFEKVVGKLLSNMGYGDCTITPGSGDKGVDGIVSQDKLGLERIFFQAKRYGEGNYVTAHDVRDFVGTLDLHGVNKGIFITTSRFPKDTEANLQKTPKHIILVEGPRLAQLMIEHDVGVSTEKIYKIKKIDSDFFIED